MHLEYNYSDIENFENEIGTIKNHWRNLKKNQILDLYAREIVIQRLNEKAISLLTDLNSSLKNQIAASKSIVNKNNLHALSKNHSTRNKEPGIVIEMAKAK